MRNLKKYNIVYDTPILRWDEALPIGNGKLGCLLYGDGPIRLTLDRVELWDSRPHPATLEEGFCYQNLLRLVKSGKDEDWTEYERLFDKIAFDYSYPTKLTAGRLELDFGKKSTKIHSTVDLKTATAQLVDGDGAFEIEAFTSATRFVGVAKIRGEFALDIRIPKYISNAEAEGGLGYPEAEIVREEEWAYYIQETHTPFRYGILTYRKNCGTHEELYFTIMVGKSVHGMLESAKEEILSAVKLGYNTLKKEHEVWWEKYWKQSALSIPDALLEKTYYRSWYLFASCSRKGFYPMPLQGVWTADDDRIPPWKGDYHHDTNTQLSYQAFLKANRLEEGRVFIDYLWGLREEFRAFAKNFFGVDGILLPSCSTIDGKPIGGWAHYAFSPTMTIWAAQSFDEYYLYTGDKQFLKEYAYPYFEEVGQAIFGLLEERNGKLYLPLSTSPEIYDATRQAYLEPNSNFDLALLRYLYERLCAFAEILGKDGSRYASILARLDEIAIDEEGVLLLDRTQRLPESHRHFSHLMAMYPLHLINYEGDNRRVYENTLLHIEQLGTGWWVGFSFAMCAQLYAMAEKGNAAYEKLYAFCKGFVADNGFHLNGDFKGYGYSQWHYRPFTLESLFGYCDALQEMLLQEHQGYIHLFPAIPQEWQNKKITFTRFRSYGGVEVGAEYLGGKTTRAELRLSRKTTLRIKNTFGGNTLTVKQGKTLFTIEATDGYFTITAPRGKVTLTGK